MLLFETLLLYFASKEIKRFRTYRGFFITVRNEVAKVMFLRVSVCPQRGVPGQVHPWTRCTPQTRYTACGTRYTPQTRYIPRDQVPPGTRYTPRPGTPPGTRYTPLDQVHPQTRCTPGTRYTPSNQVHPPGTRYTHRTRYPCGTRYTNPRLGTPPDQVQTPQTRYTPPRDQVPGRRLTLQMVHILLECILVYCLLPTTGVNN